MFKHTFLLGWALFRPAPGAIEHPAITNGIISGSRCQCEIRPDMMDQPEIPIDFLTPYPKGHGAYTHSVAAFLHSLESALLVQEHWANDGFRPLAMAMRPQDAQILDDIMREAGAINNRTNPNYQHEPLTAQKFKGTEQLLGYDVLGYRWGWESFLCNGLEVDLANIFHGSLSPHGLITDENIAINFAQYINDNDAGEPGCRYFSYAFFAPE